MGAGRYDVIVVGARIAGAATAMLLARQGMRVLAVDRVCFLSDTVSSHQLQVPGVAGLHQWGLLGKLTAAGTPPRTAAAAADTARTDMILRFGMVPSSRILRLWAAAARATLPETAGDCGSVAK